MNQATHKAQIFASHTSNCPGPGIDPPCSEGSHRVDQPWEDNSKENGRPSTPPVPAALAITTAHSLSLDPEVGPSFIKLLPAEADNPSALGTLQRLDPASLAQGIGAIAPEDSFAGQEHEVYFDRVSGKGVKLTLPGGFGARGSVSGYLNQMKLINELFSDQVTISGTVQYPGETGSRLVSTQPWVHGDESSLEEIDVYMRRKGYQRMFDGAWWNPSTGIQVTDALPKNFRTDKHRSVHPIDLILSWPSAKGQERIEDMVNAQPQPEPQPEPPAPPA